ncbi:bifunctional glutamate/proline--tRNA ligase-like isoform X27 [Adelges cooleyi]|uniref:bifunctional glutamate/proline--tRNA ligase-like isoform X27 n=1 Tax=Adelges cooleyi TaxID=133065 RepID=UPI00217FE42C|nr:bifunctional glutamate/proline--tRNA ligase-like isoform X27 [Adelges cooleyi]
MAEKIYHRRLAASHTTAKIASIEIKETESSISINGVQVPNSYKDIDLTRYIARLVSNKQGTSNKGKTNCSYLYGKDIEEQLLVDSWLSFVVDDEKKNQVEKLQYLDKSLSATSTTSKYLVGTTLTIADIVVFCWLENLQDKKAICVSNKLTHVERWSQFISSLPSFKNAEDKNQSQTKNSNPDTKEQGKFVELPGAELGKVVVRFPPEASGYLHIGHAKAALLNQYYQEQFKGRLIMRFDDTNPAKEKEDYEKVILEDVKLLEIKPDVFSYTSNYFDKMISLCEQMLKKGMAYVDDTDPETMKQEREKRIESKNRNNSVDKNVKLWNEMLSATPTGLKCCVRAKIDMLSDNGCMRDPAIYRCKPETHPRTGNKYKVYPTYDFACPIVDSLEGVTHALRTTEYADRDQQYYWFCDALELNPRPYVWSYSRLNMTNTVLSKRKLTWFVDEGLVDGWDDPRMPTVRGVLRRGMQVEALRQFIIAQGSSRTVVTMEWDKIWSINKRIVDPVAPRHTTVELNASVPVYVEDVKEPYVIKNVQRHPKNPDLGTKDVWITPTLLIDYVDAEGLASSGVGAKVTFINWGNVIVTKIDKNSSGKIESINIKTALNDTDYKKTTKLTWLPKIVPAENKSSDVPALVPCFCVFFNHLISKPVLAKDEDFKQYVSDLEDLSSCKTRLEVPMLGDPELRNVKKGQVIQLQRRPGYFICDTPYQPFSIHTSKECPVILFSVPDGHTKQQATVSSSNSAASEKKSNQAQTPNCANTTNQENELYTRVTDQGDKVRQLKSSGASKDVVSEAVKALLALKAEYKQASGKDYQPNQPPAKSAPTQPTNVPSTTNQEEQLYARVTEQGDKVRQLKSSGASKDAVSEAVKALLALKAEYKSTVGKEYQAGAQTSKPQSAPPSQKNVGKSDKKGDKKVDQKKKQEKSTASVNASEAGVKKITRLGLEAKKFVDLPDWYSQVLTKGEMIEYYDVSGCYVLRPWSFGIWEQLQKWFDNVIKRQLGVRNCYFPIFVSKAVLEKEKAHIEDFAPEVAWVTKSGDTELQEHIAIRPTSETVMYPAFAKWIQSYRDLPLKLNQWNNVVRWEFKHPQPFLRTREFLWQEGHHAYATQDEAERDVLKVLDFYKQVYEDLLAVPVVPGKKTEKEKFAGGVFTTTVEAYVPASGRAIQAATSHYLGTNFARMFDVQFEHPDTHQPEYAHQISYGMTTRTIGVMVMVHGDDRGLLLPPKVATVQVIIVPCGVGASTEPSVKDRLLNLCDSVKNALLGDQDPVPSPNSIRAETDLRDNYSPGWKFNHWELKGVPLRIEIGPKDMEAGRVIAIRRDTSEKIEVSLGKEGDLDSGFPKKIQDILDRVQSSMLEKARNEMNAKMVVCKDWSKFCPLLDSKHILLIPFCGRPPCEDLIKKDSAKDTVVEQSSVEGSQEQSTATMGAKSLCIPYQQPKEPENQIGPKTLCLHPECGQPAAAFTLFGRSY